MSWPFNFLFSNQNNPYLQFPISDFLNMQNTQFQKELMASSINNYINNAAFNFNPFLNHPIRDQNSLFQSSQLPATSQPFHRYRQVIQIHSNSTHQNHFQQKHDSKQNKNKKQTIQNEARMTRFRRRRRSCKPKNTISHNCSLRNDTKNIPKNYGKAMLSYIQKNSKLVKELLQKYQVDYLQFLVVVKKYKSKINTIHDLREMWGENDKDNKIKKCLRILSYHFMRKKCLPYIFNSRVKNYNTHIKYRKRIIEGIQRPELFTSIKQF